MLKMHCDSCLLMPHLVLRPRTCPLGLVNRTLPFVVYFDMQNNVQKALILCYCFVLCYIRSRSLAIR